MSKKCSTFARFLLQKRFDMKYLLKIVFLTILCCTCGFVYAEESAYNAKQVKLTYQGFPYKKTTCADPLYEAGSVITLPSTVPSKDGKILKGWTYTGAFYEPGASFTLPETDVVLEPVWQDGSGIESVQESDVRIQKVIRDGQLLILRDGKAYNVLGAMIDN